jgi:outer membrane protein OmpA-like peptidoglycan-associated protein
MFKISKQITHLALLMITVSVHAGDVKMFSDHAPSAAEMGRILFSSPSSSVSAPVVKTRSISFGKKIKVQAEVSSADTVGLPIKFAYNSSKILPESRPFLDEIGKMLSLEDFSDEKLVIEGHTDASGSKKYNQYLSKRRAQSVKSYLVSEYQIASARLFVTGKGESTPLEGTSAYAGINRRVQFYKAP